MSSDTKTTNPTQAAAPHNPFAAFDPMAIWQAFQTQMNAWTAATAGQPFMNPVAAWTQAQQMFATSMTDSVARAQSWSDEYAAIETQMLARANAAIDQWAKLAHDTLSYTAQLSSQARTLGVDAARKASHGA